MAAFITLEAPSKPMQTEALAAGFYETEAWGNFPRLQLLTVEDLLSGDPQLEMPHEFGTFRRATRAQSPRRRPAGTPPGVATPTHIQFPLRPPRRELSPPTLTRPTPSATLISHKKSERHTSRMRIGMDFGTTNSGIAHYDGEQLRLLALDPAAPNSAVAPQRSLPHPRPPAPFRPIRHPPLLRAKPQPPRPTRAASTSAKSSSPSPSCPPSCAMSKSSAMSFRPGRLFLSFKSSLASRSYVGTAVGEDFYLLEDIIALYLYSARRRAEREWGAELREVVLGRPVRYAEDEEQDALAQARMLQAAFLAGFQRVHFAYEPVAAAYAYTLRPDFRATTPQTLLVFDFGGGTLDISIVKSETVRSCEPTRAPALTVLATGGIAIAGDAFDSRIVPQQIDRLLRRGQPLPQRRPPGCPSPPPITMPSAAGRICWPWQQPNTLESLRRIARSAEQPARIHSLIRLITSHYGLRLFEIAEAAKRHLSTDYQATLQLDEDGLAFDERLSRREFERLIRPDLRQISARLDEVLAAAGLRPRDIDAVLRTGGSAQIPCFVALLEERFGATKVRSMDTFSSVTAGLAIIAQRLSALRDGKKRLDGDLPEGVLASADHTPESHAVRPAPAAQQLPRVPSLHGRKKRVPALCGRKKRVPALCGRKKRVSASYRETKASERLPRVPLKHMQQLIDLRGRKRASTANLSWLIGRGADGQMVSVPSAAGITGGPAPHRMRPPTRNTEIVFAAHFRPVAPRPHPPCRRAPRPPHQCAPSDGARSQLGSTSWTRWARRWRNSSASSAMPSAKSASAVSAPGQTWLTRAACCC